MPDVLTFNQFQAALEKHDVDPKIRYFLTMIFERQTHMANDLETMAKVVLQLANSVQGFVELHEATQRQVKRISRGLSADGVDVASVLNEPEH